MKQIILFLPLFLFMASCDAIMGDEIGRLPINKISTEEDNLIIKETTIDLKKGDVIDFWSEIDLEAEGELALEFKVKMFKDGDELEMFEVFPFQGNITMNEKKLKTNDKIDWSFTKKNTSKTINEDGKYTFSGILLSNHNEKLKLNKAELVIRKKEVMEAIIKTNKGEMRVELYDKETPATVANFVKLAKDGYYNGLKWHRVIPDFVIQGGCPNSRDGANGMPGTGGPGYTIDCEVTADKQYHERGVLSMAHAGRNTGGSQFFVCHSRNNTAHLDGNHTCFGKVIEGVDVVDDIRQGDSIDSIEIID